MPVYTDKIYVKALRLPPGVALEHKNDELFRPQKPKKKQPGQDKAEKEQGERLKRNADREAELLEDKAFKPMKSNSNVQANYFDAEMFDFEFTESGDKPSAKREVPIDNPNPSEGRGLKDQGERVSRLT